MHFDIHFLYKGNDTIRVVRC